MKHTTKAQVLAQLAPELKIFQVPEFTFLTVQEFEENKMGYLASLPDKFGAQSLVVRSSAEDEDGISQSNAGAYHSVLDVNASDSLGLFNAAESVIASYKKNGKVSDRDEIIFQAMVKESEMSGVIFTHDLNFGAPYYVVNYDDVSGLTNTVTSGAGEYANRTLYVHRGATSRIRSERFRKLIKAVQELEEVLGNEFLDIEFAMGTGLQLYLLQVRSIPTQVRTKHSITHLIELKLEDIEKKIKARLEPIPGVAGRTTVFGQMPDWNPVEMIGRVPRALSYSLYKTLITDQVWSRARERMGYASPNEQSLMISLAGHPFIDTRLSFHSYLPADLPDSIANKLVDAWVSRLRNNPELHDKVEFEIAVTIYSFDINEKLDYLLENTLTSNELEIFRDSLLRLTLPLLQGVGDGSISAAMSKVEILARQQFSSQTCPTSLVPMISDCITFGTEPFAILARHGFIAKTLLLSLVTKGILSASEIAFFQSGIRTVASELVEDIGRLQSGNIDHGAFMEIYGHLRPGSYDILSPCYRRMEDLYFTDGAGIKRGVQDDSNFDLSEEQRASIDSLLKNLGLKGFNSYQFFDYCASAISGREYGKFIFTRSISAMLELIADFGEERALSREDMSHVPLEELLKYTQGDSKSLVRERLLAVSKREAYNHELNSMIRLPQVLFDEAGVRVIPFQVSHPNFITSRKISSSAVYLNSSQNIPSIEGCIVMIEGADPGYDWIFAKGIAGLITKYGGANSHMAIRCAEFGVPAAIGCGEQRFEACLLANRITLDCSTGLIVPMYLEG